MFFGRAPKRALRIYFATDVHGSDRCFRKFLAAADSYEADVLVLGGDIAGKGLVPIRSHDGSLSAKVRGEPVTVPRNEEERLRAEINRLGFYPIVAGDPEIQRMEAEPAFLDAAFERAIVDQIRGWCRLAEERLAPRVRCIITPGNDDPKAIDAVLRAEPRIESPEAEICDLGPVVMASCGDVTPTPWNTAREYSEEELGNRLEKILENVPAGRKVVVNFHCPPYGSGLDFAAELDAQLRPVIRGADRKGVVIRLLGGVAVYLQSPPGGPLLPRPINDIDVVAKRGARTAVTGVLVGAGYTPDEMFNALHGSRRLLFFDEEHGRKLDVFVGQFVMCHQVPVADRLEREALTVPLAELLTTKLQIVELTERDQRDIYNLVYHHEVTAGGGLGIEADYIGELCARDWGLWRTAKATIARCKENLAEYKLDVSATHLILERLDMLWARIEATTKTAKWRLRSRVGDRVRWYDEPEENPQ